jgi:hypothetical protein
MAAPFAMFGGARHSYRHHRRGAVRPSFANRGDAQAERGAMAGVPAPTVTAAVFWPDAPADLADYLFFPKGVGDRFWSYGYGAIVEAAFATSDIDDPRTMRSRRVADGDSGAAARSEPNSSAPPCDSAASDADAAIARIERAIEPSAQQRDVLEQLRTALGQATERIKATCPAAKPAAIAQRFKAVQDRVWAMRDALLTIRQPFEDFYASLSDDQRWRLHRDEADARETAAKPAEGRAQMCGGAAAAEDPLRTIERAMAGDAQQRAGFQTLRQASGAMAQLIASSCPTYPLLGHMDRFTAAADRLDVMLFAVMAMSPALEAFYGSLDDNQKRGLGFAMRQRRPPNAADGF